MDYLNYQEYITDHYKSKGKQLINVKPVFYHSGALSGENWNDMLLGGSGNFNKYLGLAENEQFSGIVSLEMIRVHNSESPQRYFQLNLHDLVNNQNQALSIWWTETQGGISYKHYSQGLTTSHTCDTTANFDLYENFMLFSINAIGNRYILR